MSVEPRTIELNVQEAADLELDITVASSRCLRASIVVAERWLKFA